MITPKRITHSEADEGHPAFFPDGQRIAFVSARAENPAGSGRSTRRRRNDLHQIYTINTDGSEDKHLNPNAYDCYSPTISPDGKTIAFVSGRENDIEIYLMDKNGSNGRRITNGIGISIQPVFSPDGKKFEFVSDRSGALQIYLMHLNQPVTQKMLIQHLQSE